MSQNNNYLRSMHRERATPTKKKTRSKKKLVLIVVAVFFAIIGLNSMGTSHAISPNSEVYSGWAGYCLDDYHNINQNNNQVDIWGCNNSLAQSWNLSLTNIRHDNLCLTAQSTSTINLSTCDNLSSQIWLRDQNSFYNPENQMCLAAPNASDGGLLSLEKCSSSRSNPLTWSTSFDYKNYQCQGSQGQVVACNAIKQWMLWQNQPYSHEQLLTGYTGGAPYEEWCADFVSYIYKVSNYPFKNGNYNSWDENIANQIVNQGFSVQYNPNYQPSPGDVAYFNYNGGHVEIVISGGNHPTFIYGDSATIDPTTNNGQMEANTITSVKGEGSLQYYLSPNQNT